MTEQIVTAPTAAPVADSAPMPVAAPAPAIVESAAPAAPVTPAVESPAAPATAAPAAEKPTYELQPSFLDDAVESPAPAPEAPPTEAAPETKAPQEADAAPAPEAAPIVYDFAFPEGFSKDNIDNERFTEFTGLLSSDRIPPEKAQKFLDMHVAEVQRAQSYALDQVWQNYHKQQNGWKSQIRDDREFGGDRLPMTKAEANAFIEQYGGSSDEQAQLRRDLFQTGAGNSPALVRAMARAGRMMAREGAPVVAPPPRQAPVGREQRGLNRYSASSTPGSKG